MRNSTPLRAKGRAYSPANRSSSCVLASMPRHIVEAIVDRALDDLGQDVGRDLDGLDAIEAARVG